MFKQPNISNPNDEADAVIALTAALENALGTVSARSKASAMIPALARVRDNFEAATAELTTRAAAYDTEMANVRANYDAQIEALSHRHAAERTALQNNDTMALAESAIAAERTRWGTVLASPAAAGRTDLAITLLGENLTASAVTRALEASPQGGTGFMAYMAANAVNLPFAVSRGGPPDPKAERLAEIATLGRVKAGTR